jgi:hypothetical protein
MALECVTYVSSAVGHLTDAELEGLLLSARRRNEEQQVTGALLYHDGSFFQYFEGPSAGVLEVYGHIQRSSLHRGIIELVRSQPRERQFPDWLMGFTRVPKSTILQLSNASWQSSVPALRGGALDSDGMELLLGFWRTHRGGSQ